MPKITERQYKYVEQEIGNAIDLQKKYSRKSSKETVSFLPIQINGEITKLIYEAAKAKKTNPNDWILQLILTELNNEYRNRKDDPDRPNHSLGKKPSA